MADLPNWQSLQKSQDDPETIEEAISRIVAEHEADPEAHLGEGESLQQHKTFEILDHPAGSVVADKQSSRDLTFDITFSTLDGWDHNDPYTTVSSLRLYMEVDSGHANGYASVTPFSEQTLDNVATGLILQAPVWFQYGEGTTAEMSWHLIGFKIENGRVRGWQLWDDTTTPWYSVDMTKVHVLRAVYFNIENKVKYYVDGDLIGELDFVWEPGDNDMIMNFYHNRGSGNDDIFYAQHAFFGTFADAPPI